MTAPVRHSSTRLDRDQHEAATAPPGPLLVIAGAGAGKTRTLIPRAGYAVERGPKITYGRSVTRITPTDIS